MDNSRWRTDNNVNKQKINIMDYTIKDGEFFRVNDPLKTHYIRLTEKDVISTIHKVDIITVDEYETETGIVVDRETLINKPK